MLEGTNSKLDFQTKPKNLTMSSIIRYVGRLELLYTIDEYAKW